VVPVSCFPLGEEDRVREAHSRSARHPLYSTVIGHGGILDFTNYSFAFFLSANKKRILHAKACPYREEVGDELELFRDGEARLDQVEKQGGGHDRPAVHHGVVRLSYITGGQANLFTEYAIANLKILRLIPLSQIREILLVCQSANPQSFMINSQISKFPQNTSQHCLKTVLKVAFLL
jgi:hypothetical protein